MTRHPHALQGTDLLQALCERLEITWNERRDATVVDRLAEEHPEFAEALYQFFAVVVQAELDLDQNDPSLADIDARARMWLESGGYAQAAEVARQQVTPPSTTGTGATVRTPVTTQADAGAQVSSGREESHPSHIDTPAAGSPAAGVAAGGPPSASRLRGPELARARNRPKRRTFLGLLIDTTGETPEGIAAELGVNANFLVGVDELRDELPTGAREELALRAERRYRIARATGLEHLNHPGALPKAASRRGSYGQRLTYIEIVRRSKMAAADEAFWLSLADPTPQIPE